MFKHKSRISAAMFMMCFVFLVAEHAFGSWTQTTSLPVTGYQYDPVINDGTVYVVGGYNGEAFTTTYYAQVLSEDGDLGPWNTTTPLPMADQGPGVAVANGHIYAGLHSNELYSAQINPDGSIGSWVAQTVPGPNIWSRMTVETYNSRLYMIGGWDGGGGFYDTCYFADINQDGSLGSWQSTTSMPQGRQHQSVHFQDDRVYVIGGITAANDSGILDSTISAPVNPDGTFGEWRYEADLPHRLWYHDSVLIDGEVFLFGGDMGYSYNPQPVDVIYRGIINESDGSIGEWIILEDMPNIPYTSGCGVVYEDQTGNVYLIGGASLSALTDQVWRGPVPEPATMGLLTVGGLAMLKRRKP